MWYLPEQVRATEGTSPLFYETEDDDAACQWVVNTIVACPAIWQRVSEFGDAIDTCLY